MPRFTEETLNQWRFPPSETEQTKLSNAKNAVRNAIVADPVLSTMQIEVYGQGSYANDTNVRANSDIDINVRLLSPVFFTLPSGRRMEEFGYFPTTYTFADYKQAIQSALVGQFGATYIKREDKCIRFLPNTYRVMCDVVPTWKYNHHNDDSTIVVGAKFISDFGKEILNFLLKHVKNGKKRIR
jgi:hypothetical protein